MKKITLIILTSLFISCNSIYRSTHKKTIRANDDKIKELTALVDKNERKIFLSMLRTDSTFVNLDTNDTLGFNYFKRETRLCFNSDICFDVKLLLYKDSIISAALSPSFNNTRPGMFTHYQKTFIRSGWTEDKDGYFDYKYFDFKSSTIPVPDTELKGKSYSSQVDSLMSPFYFKENINYLANMSADELYYLLHSISPHKRAGTIKYIKCKEVTLSPGMETWIAIAKKNAPFMLDARVIGGRAVSFGYQPIDYYLRCETK